jgi:NitT/TauT family transport system substrate-binding protein
MRTLLLSLALAVIPGVPPAASPGSIRAAFNDVPAVEMLNFLTAVERARQRGLDITVDDPRSEPIAMQAVLLGQADIGMGTPYAAIQKSAPTIRLIYQLNVLRFFPVVNTDSFDSWQDLDGADVYVHGHGSGTEAIMNQMTTQHGIMYRRLHYLPGSGVRARAMLRGQINASIVDLLRRNLLRDQGQNRFKFLPTPENHASDEALYANERFLQENRAAVGVSLEELLKVWLQVNTNPEYFVESWKRHGSLRSNLGPDLEDDIRRYYSEMVKDGVFPNDGGGRKAAEADLAFYHFAGTLKRDFDQLKVEDYWDLEPLHEALSAVRQQQQETAGAQHE